MVAVEQVYSGTVVENNGWFRGVDPAGIDSLINRVQDPAVPEEARREAFGQVAGEAYESVFHLATSLTGSAEDAQDVAQDTFRRAWQYLPSFRKESLFSTWLYRVTANAATDFGVKKARRREELGVFGLDFEADSAEPRFNPPDSSPDVDPEAWAATTLLCDQLGIAIGGLTENLRAVIILRASQDLSHRQIAERLNISEVAAKVRLHRARTELKEILSETP